MNAVVNVLHDKLHSLQEQVEWLQHSHIMKKTKKIKRYIPRHAMLFSFVGIIILLTLSPFLVVLTVLMAPVFLLLVVSSSFVFLFLFNVAVVVLAGAVSCYILYRITWLAINRIQTCLTYIASCPWKIRQYCKTRMYELISQLLDGFTDDETQQNVHCVQEHNVIQFNASSELEDIEPDYRDRETKLYEALVSRPEYTGQDTFEPSQY